MREVEDGTPKTYHMYARLFLYPTFATLGADSGSMAKINVGTVRRMACAIEDLLADSPPLWALAKLVAWDGNCVLDNTSDAAAAHWLGEIADLHHVDAS